MMMRRQAPSRRDGFTLIELLTVLAITAIMFGLIFGPMVEGFNLTNRARVQVLCQDAARMAMEQLQRDVANGVFVFHQLPDPAFDLMNGEYPFANSVSLWVVGGDNKEHRMLLPYGLVDFVPPARAADQNVN